MPQHNLHTRRISDQTIQAAGIRQTGRGWEYRTPAGSLRLKAYPGQHGAKYLWPEGKASGDDYYHLPGFAPIDGLAVLAGGEPDVWAAHSAGISCAFSAGYGERNIPPALAAWLAAQGVTHLLYAPDRDSTGMASAEKLRDMLADSDIELSIKQLLGSMGSADDMGKAWEAFKGDDFLAWLIALPPLDLPEPEPELPDLAALFDAPAAPRDLGDAEALIEIEQLARDAIAASLTKRRGDKPGYYCCPLEHGKNGKDFLFSPEAGQPIGGCQGKHRGELTRWVDLADHLGVDVRTIARRVYEQRRALGAKASPAVNAWLADYRRWFDRQVLKAASLPGSVTIEKFNSRYCSDAPELAPDRLLPAAIIKSPMGTGKTEYMARLAGGLADSDKVLAVSHRRILSAALAARLGAIDYREIEHELRRDANRLTICINSIVSLMDKDTLTFPTYDLLVIEESESLGEHIVGKTLKPHQTTEVLRVLLILAQKTLAAGGRVIAMDANAGPLTAQIMEYITGRPAYAYVNTYTPPRPKIIMHPDKGSALAVAHEAITSGQPLYLACTHPKEAESFTLPYPHPESITITRNTDDVKANEYFGDLDKHFAEAGILAASPRLDAGVDLQTPAAVVAILAGGSNSAESQLQQIGRVRQPEGPIHGYCPYRYGKGERDDWKPGRVGSERWTVHQTIITQSGELQPAQQVAFTLHSTYIARANLHRRDHRRAFITLAKSRGYAVVESDQSVEGADLAANMAKVGKVRLKERDRQALLTCPPVDTDTYHKLQQNGQMTYDADKGHDRYLYERCFGVQLTDDLADEAEQYNYPASVKNFALLGADTDRLRAKDRRALEQTGPLGVGPDISKMEYLAQTKTLVLYLLKAAFGVGDIDSLIDIERTEAEIDQAGFMDECEKYRHYIHKIYKVRKRSFDDRSRPAIAILNEILKRFGLKLDKRRVRRDGERVIVYSLDAGRVARMREMAANWAANQPPAPAQDSDQPATNGHIILRDSAQTWPATEITPPPTLPQWMLEIGITTTGPIEQVSDGHYRVSVQGPARPVNLESQTNTPQPQGADPPQPDQASPPSRPAHPPPTNPARQARQGRLIPEGVTYS